VFCGGLGWVRMPSRDFYLAHRDLLIPMGSWVAVEPNGVGLPSMFNPMELGAMLPSLHRASTISNHPKTP